MNSILNSQSAAGKIFVRGMLAALGLAAFFLPLSHAASPDLASSKPRGGQVGTEVKVTFTGNRLEDMTDVVFHTPGFTVKEVKAIDSRKVEATIAIAPDCRLGEHHMRLRGKSGFSYARTFWVGQFPMVDEVEPNDEFDKPQVVPLNTTIEGVVKPEEVDYYRVTAKKGQRISVEMEALRINNVTNRVAIDPYVAILDKDRFELAISDDSSLLKQESVVSILASEDGEYTIEVRDASYQGNGVYRAHISSSPRPLSVYPAGGKAGSEVDFTFLGDPKGKYTGKYKLPTETESYEVFGKEGEYLPVSGNRVRVSTFDNVLESGQNDSYRDELPAAQPLPLAFNGILEKEGDIDYFKFSAKQNQRFRFISYANRLGTPVDTVINIYDAKMKSIGGNDDADGSKDSRYDFRAPADGEYFLRVTDMLKRGGENFVYRVESEPFEPRILVTMPEMLRRDMQYRKQFNVPQGGYYAMTVNTRRENLSGELVFDLPQLPEGVTWEAPTIPANLSSFPILLKAAPDAPVAGGLYDLVVRNTDANKPVSGKFTQKLDLVRGNPNGTEYYSTDVSRLPIAVTERLPFRITIDQPKVPIVRNGTMKLMVRAHRDEGFDEPIVVRMLFRPPGISCPSTRTIAKGKNEIDYELNANASAGLGDWKICVLAESNKNGLMMTASPYIDLKVEEPFMSMKMSMSNVVQGEKGEIVASLETLREFPGDADVQLFGLPAKTTTQVLKANKGTTELRFPIETAEDSPIGKKSNLFCTLVFMQNGEPISQRIGSGGTIRIDPKPKEPKKPAAPQPNQVAKNAEKPAKPLSRLEQLRLEAQQKAAGGN